jgi:hypothetical protein
MSQSSTIARHCARPASESSTSSLIKNRALQAYNGLKILNSALIERVRERDEEIKRLKKKLDDLMGADACGDELNVAKLEVDPMPDQ